MANADGWQCVRGRHEIESLVTDWQAAADRAGSPAVAYPAWVLAFAEANPEFERRLHLYVDRRQQRVISVIPLARVSTVTGRAFHTGNDAIWPFFSGVLNDESPLDELLTLLLSEAGTLYLDSVSMTDAICRRLMAWGVQHRGCLLRRRVSGEAIIMLDGDWDGVARQISPHLLRDMRQGERKLRATGPLEFAAVTDPDEIVSILPEFLSLEMRGWKGHGGTAILQSPLLLSFYSGLVRRAESSQLLCLYSLRVADRLIAGELTVRAGGRIEVLKISYDESLSGASPGTVLRAAVLRDALQSGGFTRYCLGRTASWKSRWVQRTRPLYAVHIYRNQALRIMDRLVGKSTRAAIRRRLPWRLRAP